MVFHLHKLCPLQDRHPPFINVAW